MSPIESAYKYVRLERGEMLAPSLITLSSLCQPEYIKLLPCGAPFSILLYGHLPSRIASAALASADLAIKSSPYSFHRSAASINRLQGNMSASLPGHRDLPDSQYNLNTYLGRVKQSAEIADPR